MLFGEVDTAFEEGWRDFLQPLLLLLLLLFRLRFVLNLVISRFRPQAAAAVHRARYVSAARQPDHSELVCSSD